LKAKDFIYKGNIYPSEGSFSAQAPSNIALVKYWGKTDPQIPKNASLSFTLKNSLTQTTLQFKPKNGQNATLDVYLDALKMEAFKPKIESFFQKIEMYVPFVNQFDFVIQTHNSFPHSSGIASSASSFAALSLCLMQMELAFNTEMDETFFYQKAAFLARLGSGSATRSVYGSLVLWGQHPDFETASDLYGIPFPLTVHPIFETYQDTILLVDKGQKKVSSSVGHNLMNQHPFAEQRFAQANENLTLLADIMQQGDLDAFIQLVETEALSLHAMMMTANPYFILMQPQTISIIKKIWEFRAATQVPICFTLDAGANVHVLYPKSKTNKVISFIDSELSQFCENKQYICDEVDNNPKSIFRQTL